MRTFFDRQPPPSLGCRRKMSEALFLVNGAHSSGRDTALWRWRDRCARSERGWLVPGEDAERTAARQRRSSRRMQGQGNRMFALGKQACSRLRVVGGRFSGPEFGNKAAQAQRGVVGAASGSASGLWAWGSCLSQGRWVWLFVVFSGLVESFHGAAKRRPQRSRRRSGPARRLETKKARRGLSHKQVSVANTTWGNVVTGCRRSAVGGSKRVLA